MTKLIASRFALACAVTLGGTVAGLGADSTAPGTVTFNHQIAPIMYEHCASCHRPGQAAPFSLLSYQDVAKRAQLIRAVTQTRYMPPWHATPDYGSFKGERRMTDAEIALLAKWVDAGCAGGARKKHPSRRSSQPVGDSANRTWSSRWRSPIRSQPTAPTSIGTSR